MNEYSLFKWQIRSTPCQSGTEAGQSRQLRAENMAQTKDQMKQIAIRDAVIADVVENGLGNAPMSRIAKTAGVSAGTIYLYYPNKEEMLQAIYLEIKRLLGDAMIGAFRSGETTADGLRDMWFAMFDTIIERPDMFAFHEVISAERMLSPDHEESARQMAREIQAATGLRLEVVVGAEASILAAIEHYYGLLG